MRALLCLLLCLSLPLAAAPRVVSLAPSMTDSVLELGAGELLVGVLDGAERPPQLAALPSLGRYGQLDMERLLSLRPDLVLVWPGSIPDAQLARLRDFGIALYIAEPRRLDDIATQLAALGERLGRAERGRALAAEFRSLLAALRRIYARQRPLRLFYQVWDHPLYTLGGPQVVSDALQVCGARNLFADLDLAAPQVSMETVLARDPEVILAADAGQLADWRAMTQLSATRLGQLWVLPDRNLERPSYAMLAATEKLCRLLANARPGEP
jgi:vitamin B12 transport system substrate-binding protein